MGKLSHFPLETLHRLAENEGLVVDHLHHRIDDGLADRAVLGFEVQ
jgi:hypothetical protein